MSDSTSTSDRDENGRYKAGNSGGPGNPFARSVGKLRSAAVKAVSEDDIDAIMKELVARARQGDLAAVKLVLAYGIGKPAATVDPDRLNLHEWELLKAEAGVMPDLPDYFGSVSAELPLHFLRKVRPAMEKAMCQKIRDELLQPNDVLPPIVPPSTNGVDEPDIRPFQRRDRPR